MCDVRHILYKKILPALCMKIHHCHFHPFSGGGFKGMWEVSEQVEIGLLRFQEGQDSREYNSTPKDVQITERNIWIRLTFRQSGWERGRFANRPLNFQMVVTDLKPVLFALRLLGM